MNDALIAQARELLAYHSRVGCRAAIQDLLMAYWLDVPTLLVEQAAELTRLRSLLPTTADGVSIADCSELYCPHCGDKVLQYPACCVCENCGSDESGPMELEYCETVSKPKETERA